VGKILLDIEEDTLRSRLKTIDRLRDKIGRKNLIITKADKEKTTMVIMKKSEYAEKAGCPLDLENTIL
jgi:hypothetical protein